MGGGGARKGVSGGQPSCHAWRAADDWHLVLGISAGMDQKDNIAVVVLAAACAWLVLLVLLLALCSFTLSSDPRCAASWPVWIRSTVMSVLGWFAGDSAPRAVFSFLVVRPKMRCIMAVMDQKYSYVGARTVCW